MGKKDNMIRIEEIEGRCRLLRRWKKKEKNTPLRDERYVLLDFQLSTFQQTKVIL